MTKPRRTLTAEWTMRPSIPPVRDSPSRTMSGAPSPSRSPSIVVPSSVRSGNADNGAITLPDGMANTISSGPAYELAKLMASRSDPGPESLVFQTTNPRSHSYAPISTAASLTRGCPAMSVVTSGGTAVLSPASMHGESGRRRSPSSFVPQTPSGPSGSAASTNSGSPSTLFPQPARPLSAAAPVSTVFVSSR